MVYSIDALNIRKSLWRLGLILLLTGLLSLAVMPGAMATGVYFQQIPADLEKSCNLCHDNVPNLKQFGLDFKANNYDFAAMVVKTEEPAPVKEQDGPVSPVKPQNDQEVVPEPDKQKVQVELIIPGSAERGEKILLQAKVVVDGNPIAGKQVVFSEAIDFFAQGKMELGKASTGADGIATISYWPRATTEEVKLSANVAGDNEIEPALAEASLVLVVAGPLVKPFEGVHIPFMGTWVIGLLVGAVWGIYFYAGYKTLEIRKLGHLKEKEAVRLEDQVVEERKQA